MDKCSATNFAGGSAIILGLYLDRPSATFKFLRYVDSYALIDKPALRGLSCDFALDYNRKRFRFTQ